MILLDIDNKIMTLSCTITGKILRLSILRTRGDARRESHARAVSECSNASRARLCSSSKLNTRRRAVRRMLSPCLAAASAQTHALAVHAAARSTVVDAGVHERSFFLLRWSCVPRQSRCSGAAYLRESLGSWVAQGSSSHLCRRVTPPCAAGDWPGRRSSFHFEVKNGCDSAVLTEILLVGSRISICWSTSLKTLIFLISSSVTASGSGQSNLKRSLPGTTQ